MMVFLYIYFVLIVVIVAGWVRQKAPYYPIEISRIVASDPHVALFFRWALFVLPLLAYFFPLHPSIYSPLLWLAYGALQLITFWDDVDYYGVHMAGVLLLGLSFGAYTIVRATHEHMLLIILALLMWLLRLVLKGACVYFIEDNGDVWACSQNIMYKGECRYPESTLFMFKVAGVMQWMVFFIALLLLVF